MNSLKNLHLLAVMLFTLSVPVHAEMVSACTDEIVEAVATGNIEVVKSELAKGCKPRCLYAFNNRGYGDTKFSLLMITALNGRYKSHTEIASFLLENGADINEENSDGATPLFLAAEEGRAVMAEFLIKRGARVNMDGCNTLYAAAMNGHTKIVKLLIDSGAETDKLLNDGTSPLYGAVRNARNDRREIIKMLLDKGADVNIRNNEDGMSMLHIAALYSDFDLMKMLVNKGADPSARTNYGSSVLMVVLGQYRNNQADMLKLLIENGADINSYDSDGLTALMEAISCHRDAEIIRYLVSHGADVNAKDKKGNTPLSLAVNNREIADILIQAGAKD